MPYLAQYSMQKSSVDAASKPSSKYDQIPQGEVIWRHMFKHKVTLSFTQSGAEPNTAQFYRNGHAPERHMSDESEMMLMITVAMKLFKHLTETLQNHYPMQICIKTSQIYYSAFWVPYKDTDLRLKDLSSQR